MTKYKNYIIAGVIAAIAIILYFVLKGKKEETTPEAPAVKTGGETPLVSKFPIKLGSKGQEVKEIQTALNKRIAPYMLPLKVDGIFGEKTLAMLKKYAGGKTELTEAEYRILKMGGIL